MDDPTPPVEGGITRRDLLRAAAAASLSAPLAGVLAPPLPASAAGPAVLRTIDRRLALFLAGVCLQTYEQFENGGRFTPPPGYEVVLAFRATADRRVEWFGFVIESADAVVVAFRGSKSDPDFLADGDIVRVPYPYASGWGRTHSGFTAVYRSCRDAAIAALRSRPASKPLYVTGHSLGGALAVLCAADVVANTPFARAAMYSLAGPRVGDARFAAAYDARVRTSVRVVNRHDIVPMMPGAGYRHVHSEYTVAFQTRTIGGNHALANYIEALRR